MLICMLRTSLILTINWYLLIEEEVNPNGMMKILIESIGSIDSRIMNESVPISLNHFVRICSSIEKMYKV